MAVHSTIDATALSWSRAVGIRVQFRHSPRACHGYSVRPCGSLSARTPTVRAEELRTWAALSLMSRQGAVLVTLTSAEVSGRSRRRSLPDVLVRGASGSHSWTTCTAEAILVPQTRNPHAPCIHVHTCSILCHMSDQVDGAAVQRSVLRRTSRPSRPRVGERSAIACTRWTSSDHLNPRRG